MDGRPAAGDLAPTGATRHEVEATVPYAVVEGPGGPPHDRFLFYQEAAVGGTWRACGPTAGSASPGWRGSTITSR